MEQYFVNRYNKLEADALLYNRRLPHAGLMGSENEVALVNLLREFLPSKFGIENSGIVIDQKGRKSRQCDIVIYDSESYPKYFRKVFPIEVVYGVIEVKTLMNKGEAKKSLQNIGAINNLEFRPALTPYWRTQSKERKLSAKPPFGMIFSYRSEAKSFETFSRWFPWEFIHEGIKINNSGTEIRSLTVTSLDQGIIKIESSNGHVQRWILDVTSESIQRSFETKYKKNTVIVDPAKTLFVFLETLWQRLSHHSIHPGFDIRSYMNFAMSSIIAVDNEI